jgi:hypothetical protein
MFRSFTILTFGAATALLAMSCTEDTNTTSGTQSSSSSSSSGGNATAAEACAALGASVCAKVNECSQFLLELTYGDIATCEARIALGCPSVFDSLGSTTTPDDMAACAEAYSTVSCNDLYGRKLPPGCTFPPGTQANGMACGREVQCASGHCSNEGELCGVCAAPLAVGGACKSSNDCEPSLFCAQGKCAVAGDVGATCDAAAPCITGIPCSGGKCVEPLGPGQTCDMAAPNCDTLQGLGCNMMGICQKVKLAGPGEACGLQGTDYIACKGGGFCKTMMNGAGTCVAPAADGAACDEVMGPRCLPGARCSSGKCVLADGSSCN